MKKVIFAVKIYEFAKLTNIDVFLGLPYLDELRLYSILLYYQVQNLAFMPSQNKCTYIHNIYTKKNI